MNPYDNSEALLRVLAAPRRNQFFYGKRMDVQHFRMEQDYTGLKRSLLNRLTLGKGVLCGLNVSVDGDRLCIDPGVAIDGLGREIVVPVRSCIDPAAADRSCCGGSAGATPAPASNSGLFTLWACYRECHADYQPVLASDCDAREQCAPGTTVETFCFKVTPGLAPLQSDPEWCTKIRPDAQPHLPPGTPAFPDIAGSAITADPARESPGLEAIRDALRSRRHLLCMLTDGPCDAADGDPCVPLAAVSLSDGHPTAVESCLVRPRVYSNAMLLDLILCLAERIDECCKDSSPAELLHVRSIDFIQRNPETGESLVASVDSPLVATAVKIGGRTDAIRIRFSKPFAQDANRPSTHSLNDADFERHNVQVLPQQVLNNMPYVPGTIAIESPDTLRFDLFIDSPYSRGPLGWQKGRYRIVLRGTEDLARGRRALTDLAGVPLDGEAIAPASGVISGDGSAAGDFSTDFVVG